MKNEEFVILRTLLIGNHILAHTPFRYQFSILVFEIMHTGVPRHLSGSCICVVLDAFPSPQPPYQPLGWSIRYPQLFELFFWAVQRLALS